MIKYSRRDVLRVGAYLAAGMGLGCDQRDAICAGLEKIADRNEQVVWLHGMSCSGCSVSFLNAEEPDPLEILTDMLSLVYHPTISAAQGVVAMDVVNQAVESKDYYLVVEGSIPLGMPEACVVGGRPLSETLEKAARNAKAIVAAGTCASFGGIPAAEGNETGAVGVRQFMEHCQIPIEERLINCPGCPVHPQTLLGTVAYVIGKGLPQLDPELLTPTMYCDHSVHDECPKFHYWEKRKFAKRFGDEGCLFELGCLGPLSMASCSRRRWNGGVNWCIGAGAPCTACSSNEFAQRRDFPFYRKGEGIHEVANKDTDRGGAAS